MSLVDLNRFSKQIERLELANRAIATEALSASPRHAFPQPVHVMYGGAHLLSEKIFEKIAARAKEAFEFAAKDSKALNKLCGEGWSDNFAEDIFLRIRNKIESAPIEDYRIDFEDGYGVRTDDQEDAHAKNAARLAVSVASQPFAPRSLGIRVKPLSTSGMRRSLKTLDIFVQELAKFKRPEGTLKHLIVTLPKVTNSEQVATLVEILEGYERELHLGHDFFSVELIIEAPEAFLAMDGSIPMASFLHAAGGRCRSLHFGVYDFTSSLGIGSAGQGIDHVACDFARMWMQVLAALAPNVSVSDGIISHLPLIPKDSSKESLEIFQSNWRYNYRQMMRSLSTGYYQGWDLHPSQIPIRHIANHVFVLKELPNAASRLKAFYEKASQASHVGGVFDDRASVLGLLNFFDRALLSGVFGPGELESRGLDLRVIRQSI